MYKVSSRPINNTQTMKIFVVLNLFLAHPLNRKSIDVWTHGKDTVKKRWIRPCSHCSFAVCAGKATSAYGEHIYRAQLTQLMSRKFLLESTWGLWVGIPIFLLYCIPYRGIKQKKSYTLCFMFFFPIEPYGQLHIQWHMSEPSIRDIYRKIPPMCSYEERI